MSRVTGYAEWIVDDQNELIGFRPRPPSIGAYDVQKFWMR